MKARAIVRRGAITLGAVAAAIGGIGLSTGTAQASTHAHRNAFIMPQSSDPSGGLPSGVREFIMPQPGDDSGGPSFSAHAQSSAFIMPQPSDPESGPS